jgi:hypothetical protein
VTPRKVLIPLVMIALSAAVLLVYNRTSMALPAFSPSPLATDAPSASPSADSTARSAPLSTTVPQAVVPSVGDQAPLFSLPSVWGEKVSLEHYRGITNVVLLFYRTGG